MPFSYIQYTNPVIGGSGGSGGGFKESIVLCDSKPGTRNTPTLAVGTYRIAVVGAGGGAHATPGSAAGGTSSFGGLISATGGAAGAAGGAGSGGDINTSGGATTAAAGIGGGASGHRLGNAPDQYDDSEGGGGWSSPGVHDIGGMSAVDGLGLGIPPGAAMQELEGAATGRYGCGASQLQSAATNNNSVAGIGGGGSNRDSSTQGEPRGGPGGGGAGSVDGAATNAGSGGGYAEKILVVAVAGVYSYTVGAGGTGGTIEARGGDGMVIVEKLA